MSKINRVKKPVKKYVDIMANYDKNYAERCANTLLVAVYYDKVSKVCYDNMLTFRFTEWSKALEQAQLQIKRNLFNLVRNGVTDETVARQVQSMNCLQIVAIGYFDKRRKTFEPFNGDNVILDVETSIQQMLTVIENEKKKGVNECRKAE